VVSGASFLGVDARVGLRPSPWARPKAVTRVRDRLVGSGGNWELLDDRLGDRVGVRGLEDECH